MRNFSSVVIPGATMKFVELQDDVVINGHVYDKSTLQPKPNNFLYVPSTANNEISIDRIASKDAVGTTYDVSLYGNIFVDSENPDIIWTVRTIGLNGSSLLKIEKLKDGSYSVIEAHKYASYNSFFRIIGQDKNYVYFHFRYTHAATKNNYSIILYRLDKNTLVVTGTTTTGTGTLLMIDAVIADETVDNLYYICTLNSYSVSYPFYIWRLNKTTWAWEWWTLNSIIAGWWAEFVTGWAGVDSYGNINPLRGRNPHEIIFFNSTSTHAGDSNDHWLPELWTLKLSPRVTEVPSAEKVEKPTIVPDALKEEARVWKTGTANFYTRKTRAYNFEVNGKNYIVWHTTQLQVPNVRISDPDLLKIWVFEDTDSAYVLKSVTSLGVYYSDAIQSRDGRRILMMYDNGVDQFSFDEDQEKFVLTGELSCSPFQMGFDRNNKIIVFDVNKTLYIEDPADAYSVKSEFIGVPEESDFATDIEAKLRITMTNNRNVSVPGNVRITLTGAAYFKDDSKSGDFAIPSSGTIDIDVIIKKPTSYTANVSFISA